jgi:predicted ArsR family transcriptional regulator
MREGQRGVPRPEQAGALDSLSAPKRQILLILKREGEVDLEGLSQRLSISKMAAYKHVRELEERGLVERFAKRMGVGRPRLGLRLASGASSIFPQAYSDLTCFALQYIEEKLGREGVETALRRRQMQVLSEYEKRVRGKTLEERVRELAELRDSEGYMAEVKVSPGGHYELLEYNCPILAVAERYWEACNVERELFRRVLGADVETTHRVVAGDHVCRFLIKARKREFPE